MNWSWQLCTWKTSDVQPKCQGPLQLLSPPFLMTNITKQMPPNEKGRGVLQQEMMKAVLVTEKCKAPIESHTNTYFVLKHRRHTLVYLHNHHHTHSASPLILLCHLLLNCTSFWDRPKLYLSFLTQSHQLFLTCSLSNSFKFPCNTMFDPVIIIFTFHMSKPSQPTLFDQTDWFQS